MRVCDGRNRAHRAPAGRNARAESPPSCRALSGRPENARAERVRDKVDGVREHAGARSEIRKAVDVGHCPPIDRDDDAGSRRLGRKRVVRTAWPATRSLRRAVVCFVVRAPLAARRLFGEQLIGMDHRPMTHRNRAAADPDVIAASGLGSARAQQQTGTERHKGGSPVSQRPQRDESDHQLTNRSVLLSRNQTTSATAARVKVLPPEYAAPLRYARKKRSVS